MFKAKLSCGLGVKAHTTVNTKEVTPLATHVLLSVRKTCYRCGRTLLLVIMKGIKLFLYPNVFLIKATHR